MRKSDFKSFRDFVSELFEICKVQNFLSQAKMSGISRKTVDFKHFYAIFVNITPN